MIRLCTAILFLVSVLCTGLGLSDARAGGNGPTAGFFSGIEDLPLMPGLTELPEATLVFDSPSGRYVEVYAIGLVLGTDIEHFYSASLPQLGWTAIAGPSYQREGEVLEIKIVGPAADDGSHTVRFAISPGKTTTSGE